MLALAHRIVNQLPASINPSLRNKMQRIVHRSFADKINDDHKNQLTSSNNKEVISSEKHDKRQLQEADDEGGELKDLLALMDELDKNDGKVNLMAQPAKQVFFNDEQKALMMDKNQRIPFACETEPGVFCVENSVKPLISFPDPCFVELEMHEQVKEYSLGWPVIRPPMLIDRWKQGLSFSPPDARYYPWIQEFRSHYDLLIIGGGLVGSCIANFLAEKIKVNDGFRIGVVEKDMTFRNSLSTQHLGALRTQFSSPELIEAALFGADYLRLLGINQSTPNDQEEVIGWFNRPNIKFQPHGNLTLFTEEHAESVHAAHDIQTRCGAQNAMLSKKSLEKRFPWLNSNDIVGGCLGLESEGWFDSWNLLQALILRNKYLGIEYISGEMMFGHKHSTLQEVDMNHDNLYRNYEAHIFVGETKHVYPIEFSQLFIAAGGQSGNVGRMCGIGTGKGPLYMDIPVEPRRGYIFEVEPSDAPGLNFPLLSDPSGLFVKREGLQGLYHVGLLPQTNDPNEENLPKEPTADYFDTEIRPILENRLPGFKDCKVVDHRSIDYDFNYMDGTPVIGQHPINKNIHMATGFNGRGSMFAPAVGRAITELVLDDGYKTIDFSRFCFDRFLNLVETKELIYA